MWKQVISGAKMNNLEPLVSVSKSGLLFNVAAVNLVGKDQDYVVVFIDDERKLRLGFCFTKTWMSGAYNFKRQNNTSVRRVGLANFLKQNNLMDKIAQHGRYYPLKEVKEQIPDFEGSDLFCIEIG